MNSIFYIIIYSATVIFASDTNIDDTRCMELKNKVNFVVSYDVNNVFIKMNGDDYYPSFAVLYSEKNEIGKFSCWFNGNCYVQWCRENYPKDKISLNNFFKELYGGVFADFETKAFYKKRQLEILVGLIEAKVYKDIMTRLIEARFKLKHDDPANIAAEKALEENHIKECESNIIFYVIKFSDSHNDIMSKLEDYKVFEYDYKIEDSGHNENAKKNTSDHNEDSKKKDDSINEKAKPYVNDDKNIFGKDTNNKEEPSKINEEYNGSDRFSDNNNIRGDTKNPDGKENKRNNDKSSSSTMFNKTVLAVIGILLLTVGVLGSIIFIGPYLISKYF